MPTEVSKYTTTGTTPPTLEHFVERPRGEPIGRPPPGAPVAPRDSFSIWRALAGLARWVLFVVFVVLAPIALIAWSVLPRVTSPTQLADQAIESGLTEAVRVALVDQISAQLTESEDSPIQGSELRPVMDSVISQAWLEGQVSSLADELERWLDTTSDDAPDLVIDIAPVKDALEADDRAVSVIAEAMGCGNLGCQQAESSLVEMLGGVPDEVDFFDIGEESEAGPGAGPGAGPDTDPSETILEVRDTYQEVRRLIAMVPLVLIALLAVIVLLARRGSRFRWLGTALAVIAVPILVATMVVPGWASRQAEGSLPADSPLDPSSLEDLFAWAAQPAGALARWLLIFGVVALVAPRASYFVRERSRGSRPEQFTT